MGFHKILSHNGSQIQFRQHLAQSGLAMGRFLENRQQFFVGRRVLGDGGGDMLDLVNLVDLLEVRQDLTASPSAAGIKQAPRAGGLSQPAADRAGTCHHGGCIMARSSHIPHHAG